MGSGWYPAGSQAQVYAESTDPSIVFASWSGSGSGSYSGNNNPATVTMNSPITETSNWNTIQLVKITFTESGLPWYNYFGDRVTWIVTVNGVTYTANSGNSITVTVRSGTTVSWSAPVVWVWEDGDYGLMKYPWYPIPSSGSFTATASQTISIQYQNPW